MNKNYMLLYVGILYQNAIIASEQYEFTPELLQGVPLSMIETFNKDKSLPGRYPVDVYINDVLFGLEEVEFVYLADTDGDVIPCLNKSMLAKYGLDIEKIKLKRFSTIKLECIDIGLTDGSIVKADLNGRKLTIAVPRHFLKTGGGGGMMALT